MTSRCVQVPDFALFCRIIGEVREISPELIREDDHLLDNLGFDSMDMVELLAEMAPYEGVEPPLTLDWATLSVRDLYSEFVAGSIQEVATPPALVTRVLST